MNDAQADKVNTAQDTLAQAVDTAGGFPPPPTPSDSESVDMIAAAEARIANSMAAFLDVVLQKICMIRDPEEQADVIKDIFCAYTCKEKGMAALFNALANKIFADKGLLPGHSDLCC